MFEQWYFNTSLSLWCEQWHHFTKYSTLKFRTGDNELFEADHNASLLVWFYYCVLFLHYWLCMLLIFLHFFFHFCQLLPTIIIFNIVINLFMVNFWQNLIMRRLNRSWSRRYNKVIRCTIIIFGGITNNRQFSVASLYHHLNPFLPRNIPASIIWSLSIPLKVKFVTWLTLFNRLPISEILPCHNMTFAFNCILCHTTLETSTHLFLLCQLTI